MRLAAENRGGEFADSNRNEGLREEAILMSASWREGADVRSGIMKEDQDLFSRSVSVCFSLYSFSFPCGTSVGDVRESID